MYPSSSIIPKYSFGLSQINERKNKSSSDHLKAKLSSVVENEFRKPLPKKRKLESLSGKKARKVPSFPSKTPLELTTPRTTSIQDPFITGIFKAEDLPPLTSFGESTLKSRSQTARLQDESQRLSKAQIDELFEVAIKLITHLGGFVYNDLDAAKTASQLHKGRSCWYISSQNPYVLKKLVFVFEETVTLSSFDPALIRSSLSQPYLSKILINDNNEKLKNRVVDYLKAKGVCFFTSPTKAAKQYKLKPGSHYWFTKPEKPFELRKLTQFPFTYDVHVDKMKSNEELHQKISTFM